MKHRKKSCQNDQSTRPVHNGILSIIFILFFVSLIPACAAPSTHNGTPENALNSYIQALNDRNSVAVFRDLSIPLQAQYHKDYETTGRDPVAFSLYGLQRGGQTIQSVQIINQTMTGLNASIRITYFWHFSGRFDTEERTAVVELVNESGTWKFGSFFPFDNPDLMP